MTVRHGNPVAADFRVGRARQQLSLCASPPPTESAATAVGVAVSGAVDHRESDENITYLSAPTEFQMADEWYDFALATHFWYQWRFAALCTTLTDLPRDGPWLEVGCGNAAAREQIEQHFGVAVDGCDVNEFALRQASAGRGNLYFYDIHERRPEWRGHFSTIFLLDTLEHIPEPVRFLESVAYHLRPGGHIAITVPAQQWLYSRYDLIDGHVKRYSLSVLKRELRAAGLTLTRHTYWGLSLLPIIWARKIVLRFCRPERVIEVGFQPGSGAVNALLRGLMHTERACGTRMPTGACLVALATLEDIR